MSCYELPALHIKHVVQKLQSA